MKSEKMKRGFYLLFVLVLVAGDQITKYWAAAILDAHGVLKITTWFNLVLVQNPGAAFGFLADDKIWQKAFLISVSITASLIIIWWFFKSDNRLEKFALSMLLAGALGNLIDRVRLGFVIDFIDLHYQSWHWPAFNFADGFIVFAVVLWLFFNFKNR